jgi:hypothetical protein
MSIGEATKMLTYYDFSVDSLSSNEKLILDISTKLICHTPQPQNLVSNFNNLPVSGFKNTFFRLFSATRTIEHLFETTFSQYMYISSNFLIKYPKTCITAH